MRFDIITIFPNLFDSFLNESLIKKSVEKKLNKFCVHDLRRWTTDKHQTVDDRPYGGGAGMVLMAEPILRALKCLNTNQNFVNLKFRRADLAQISPKFKRASKNIKTRTILLSPTGKQFNQQMAQKFSKLDRLVFVCGRYEGVDARVEKFVDEKISIGHYVLSGGELAAMVIIEAVARLIPGYLSNPKSLNEESFNIFQPSKLNKQKRGVEMLEYPQYTRPEVLEVGGKKYRVPKALLGGDHQQIKKWRQQHTKHPKFI